MEEKVIKIIEDFIEKNKYRDNPHVLGVVVSGSHLTGLNNAKSDIDINVIFDNDDMNHLLRCNDEINGYRIEYFERPISDYYLRILNDYEFQNTAILSIIGHGLIWFEQDKRITALQKCTIDRYQEPLPKMKREEVIKKIKYIEEKMHLLEELAKKNEIYFNQLFYLTLEEIVELYHHMKGLAIIEASKRIKIYQREEYRKAFAIDNIPEKEFIDKYICITTNHEYDKTKQYYLLSELFTYIKRNISDKEIDNKPRSILPKKKKPPLNYQKAREKMSIIDNKMEKLEMLANEDNPYFDFYFYIVTERLFNLYHERNGIFSISVNEIFKENRIDISIYHKNGIKWCDQTFLTMYRELLDSNIPRIDKYKKILEFYDYVTQGINLGKKYKIPIKSRVRKKDK